MNIESWREEIDAVDSEILKLINKRARLAVEVGALKAKAGLPIYDKEREQNVLDRLCEENEGLISEDAIIEIFRKIIQETRNVEIKAVDSVQITHRDIR